MTGLLVVLIALLPSLIALRRKHEHQVAIIFLNLLAGWTGIGWIVVLVWATGRKPTIRGIPQ
jgi:Superinfection immunity protein